MDQQSPKHSPGLAAARFLSEVVRAIERVEITDHAAVAVLPVAGLESLVATLRGASTRGRKVLFIGNGGSAAIASHLATDLWKNGKIEAMTFNDPSLLTCLGNDCGYESVFAVAIDGFARPGDVLVAISSSGRSPNILRGVQAARRGRCAVVTFTGFDGSNPLRKLGDLNFYVDSHVYGIVESAHLALLHSALDAHMGYPVEHSHEYCQQGLPHGLASRMAAPSAEPDSQPLHLGVE